MNDYSVYRPSIKEYLVLSFVLMVATEGIGVLVYDLRIGFLAAPLVYPLCVLKYKEVAMKKRKEKLRNQFKDVLYSMSSSFATGDHMVHAMEKSISVLENIHGQGSDMGYELRNMINRINETGEDEIKLWTDFGRRSGVEDIRDFAEVYSSCRDAGGDIVRTVDRAAEILNQKISVENEIKIMASQKVAEGRLVGAMPILMIVFLRLTSPSYMSVMYESMVGRIVMTISMLITIAAFMVTRKVTEIEV